MMHKFLAVLAIAGGCLSIVPAQAQSLGNAPYSRFGIGEVNHHAAGSIRNFGMGGVGVSSPNSLLVNTQNPALLFYNNNVIFEMSLASQLKTLKDEAGSQRDGSTTLNTITLAIPLNKRWSAAVGLRPFSTVQYETNTTGTVEGDPNTTVLNRYSGEGGISEFYFGNGVKVGKNLTLGVEASYLFGSIDNNYVVAHRSSAWNQKLLRQQTFYRDFAFKAGFGYRIKAGEKYHIGLGGTYNFATKVDAERVAVLEQIVGGAVRTELFNDSTTGNISLPAGFQAGISLDNNSNWSVSLDVASRNWSDFKDYTGGNIFRNSLKVGLGGEYVPEPASTTYLRRVTYRAGLSFMQTPYEFEGKKVNDAAVHWGFTFPVGRAMATESAYINLGFAVGKRGTTEAPLVQETYLKVQGGISLNNKWFMKRKLD